MEGDAPHDETDLARTPAPRPVAPPPPAWNALAKPALWASLALAGCVLWALITAVADVVGYRWAQQSGEGDDGLLDLSNTLDEVSFFVGLVMAIAAIVAFLIWFARALGNLRLVGAESADTGWGVASWFVPFVNVVVPYRAMRDLWRAGHPPGGPPSLLPAWWTCWLLSLAFVIAAGIVRPETYDLQRFRISYLLDLVGVTFAVGAGVLGILVVRRITRRLEARARYAGGPERLPAPPPTPAFVTLDDRARPALLALGGMILIDLARIAVDTYGLGAVGRLIDGDRGAEDAVGRAETLVDVLGVLWFCGLVVTAVLFLRWFHRAIRNLHAPGLGLVRYEPGWAVGSWFVPFVNLVVPKRAANDAWRAGDPHEEVPVRLHLWWVLWIVGNILANVASRSYWEERKALSDEQGLYQVDLAASVVEIGAAVLAILVVREVTRRHAERLALGPPKPPPPPADADEFVVEPAWKPAT